MTREQSRTQLAKRLVSLHERFRHPQAHLSESHAATSNSVAHLEGAKYLLLESERANGTRVGTPMWFAVIDDTIFLRTEADSPKVRRISRRPTVNVAACTMRGKPRDDYIQCIARTVPQQQEAHAEAALRRGYGPLRRLFNTFNRNNYVYIELTPLSQQQPVAEDQAPASAVNAAREAHKNDKTPPGAA